MAPAASSRRRTPPRAARAKAAISYAEDSSSEVEDYDEAADSEPEESLPTLRSRPSRSQRKSTERMNTPRKYTAQRKRKHDSHDSDSGHTSTPKRRKLSKPASPNAAASHIFEHVQGSGVAPLWQTLFHHVLVRVFQYASYPLYDEHTFQPLPSIRWLLNAASMCRNFADPALSVLYSSPPLVPMVQAHRLLDLLKETPTDMVYKYRPKVESLRIDVGQVVAYSLPGSGHLDLHGLIKDLPRLVDLEFYHQKDMSPYRDLDSSIKWTYPDAIFQALEYVDPAADAVRGDKTTICQLRSWRWSSRLAGKKYPLDMLPELHTKLFFVSLKKIAFVNYQVPTIRKDEDDPKHENVLARAIEALPNLQHLVLESSTLANAKLLPLLPTGLRHLEMINCWEVVADDFSAFLLTHGRQLRCLTLNHNQSLSLSFLPTLGVACPKLESFHMNMTYFNLHSSYHDSQPQYEQLLLPEQIPVWPSTLQSIELIQLRKWETKAAEMFFQSLLDSAGSLLDLRKLTIQAILNIGWRDRASFRDKWVGSLSRVFKRVSEPPLPVISVRPAASREEPSLPQQDLVKKEPPDNGKTAVVAKRSSLRSTASNKAPSSSTSIPLRSRPAPPGSAKGTALDSPPTRRSTRTTTRALQTGKYAESSSDSEPEAGPSEPRTPARRTLARDIARRNRLARELDILKQTAGKDLDPIVSSPGSPVSGHDDSDSDDDAPLIKSKSKFKGKQKEVIQGMCDVVEVRIDNLRPTETQVTEADFLDEERSGDDDWDGDDGDEEGYAW